MTSKVGNVGRSRWMTAFGLAIAAIAACAQAASAQSTCDLVNAGNVELVVLNTGELVIVAANGADIDDGTLVDTFVDVNGDVYFGDEIFGYIGFATDGDDFRTLWWLTATGRVIDLTDITLEPVSSALFPSDFVDAGCDACLFWDGFVNCSGSVPWQTFTDAIPIDDDPPVIVDRPLTFSFCGGGSANAVAMSLMGLLGLSLARRTRG